MSLMSVPSVLPDANIPAWMVSRKFDHARNYSPSAAALANRYRNGEHYVYGLAGSAPEDVQLMDFLARHYQGHVPYAAMVGGRSGRFDYGMGDLGAAFRSRYAESIRARHSNFGYGLAGLGQDCDPTDGICVDSTGAMVGTMDPSTGAFVPFDSSSAPTGPSGPLYQVPAGTQTVAAGGTVTGPGGQTVQVPGAGASQAQMNQFWAQVAQAGIDVAKLAIIQPGTSQAGGSITRQTPGFPVNPIATSTQTGINAKVSTGAAVAGSTVALIGIALVALMVMGGKK